MSTLISNCIFGYKCDQSWDALNATNDPTVKYCGKCNKHVMYCATPEELMEAIREGVCVSIDVTEKGKQRKLLGLVSSANIPDFLKNDI